MSVPRLVLATRNPHKVLEIQSVLADLAVEIQSVADDPDCPEVIEDGATLEANAAKKARVVCAYTKLPTLADDSGLEVDALNGAPGVLSARYAGEGCSYADNNAKLLRELSNCPESRRTARFRCVIAFCQPVAGGSGGSGSAVEALQATQVELFEGRVEGRIAHQPRGQGGFGYDPVFFLPEWGCTLAELGAERKNQISHRARALLAARQALGAWLLGSSGSQHGG